MRTYRASPLLSILGGFLSLSLRFRFFRVRTQRKEEETAGGGPFFRARKFRVACIIRAQCFMQFHPTAVYASSGEDFNFSPRSYANGFYIPRSIETEGETREYRQVLWLAVVLELAGVLFVVKELIIKYI